MPFYLLIGAFFGVFNGFLSRFMLKKAISGSNLRFFSTYMLGLAYRFLFLIAAMAFFYRKQAFAALSFIFPMILMQEFFLILPIKNSKK